MTEHIVKRFEIIGAAASILAAAWFFLRPNTGGIPGAPGAPGAAGAAGIGYGGAAGTAGYGEAGAAGEPGAGGQGGTAGVDGVPGAAGASGNNYFSPFYQQTLSNPVSGTLPTLQAVTSNLPPQADVPKRYASIVGSESIPKKEPCGCGCPNQAVAAKFPDGGGSCLSSTTANLQTAMNDCQPGNLKTSLSNILSNLQRYYGNANPTPAELNAALFDMRAQFPSDLNIDALVPQSTFGAS